MIRNICQWISGAVIAVAWSALLLDVAAANPKAFAFVDPRYVITAEVASNQKFVLNVINMSDYVVVIQPGEFIYRGESGRLYIGQVYDLESKNSRGELQKYSATYLLRGHSFAGLSIVGVFREQEQIAELSVRIGAKRYYLQPVESILFEQLAAKISKLDLENTDAAAALQEANIAEMGTAKSTDGTSEWDRDWQGLITPDGVNPPKILERTEINLTSEARKSQAYGKVKLSGLINKSGGVQDLKIVKGLDRGLDKRVLEAVKNSWSFLPATKNGEVIDAVVTFEVEFSAPAKKTSERQ